MQSLTLTDDRIFVLQKLHRGYRLHRIRHPVRFVPLHFLVLPVLPKYLIQTLIHVKYIWLLMNQHQLYTLFLVCLLSVNVSICFGRYSPIFRRLCTVAIWCNYVRRMCVDCVQVAVRNLIFALHVYLFHLSTCISVTLVSTTWLLSFVFRLLLPFLCSFYLLCVFIIRHLAIFWAKPVIPLVKIFILEKTVAFKHCNLDARRQGA
jgi:hypothetical protein